MILLGRYTTNVYWKHRYVPNSRRTNKAGLKISAHVVITMETLSVRRISKRNVFLKDGLAKYNVGAG